MASFPMGLRNTAMPRMVNAPYITIRQHPVDILGVELVLLYILKKGFTFGPHPNVGVSIGASHGFDGIFIYY